MRLAAGDAAVAACPRGSGLKRQRTRGGSGSRELLVTAARAREATPGPVSSPTPPSRVARGLSLDMYSRITRQPAPQRRIAAASGSGRARARRAAAGVRVGLAPTGQAPAPGATATTTRRLHPEASALEPLRGRGAVPEQPPLPPDRHCHQQAESEAARNSTRRSAGGDAVTSCAPPPLHRVPQGVRHPPLPARFPQILPARPRRPVRGRAAVHGCTAVCGCAAGAVGPRRRLATRRPPRSARVVTAWSTVCRLSRLLLAYVLSRRCPVVPTLWQADASMMLPRHWKAADAAPSTTQRCHRRCTLSMFCRSSARSQPRRSLRVRCRARCFRRSCATRARCAEAEEEERQREEEERKAQAARRSSRPRVAAARRRRPACRRHARSGEASRPPTLSAGGVADDRRARCCVGGRRWRSGAEDVLSLAPPQALDANYLDAMGGRRRPPSAARITSRTTRT